MWTWSSLRTDPRRLLSGRRELGRAALVWSVMLALATASCSGWFSNRKVQVEKPVTPANTGAKWVGGDLPDVTRTTSLAHPALQILAYYGLGFVEGENEMFVRPYLVNLYAMEVLDYPRARGVVKEYLLWYLKHLNESDIHGLSGTMYDLHVNRQGGERWVEEYDSADSYGATFLSLLRKYIYVTGDRIIADDHQDELETIAYMIYALQDEDGLTWVRPGHDSKYLMDNCEVYMGFRDYAALQKELWEENESKYAEMAAAVQAAVVRVFFYPMLLNFHYGLDRSGEFYPSKWGVMYPDTLAQIYPVAWEVIPADSLLARHLWEQFDRYLDPGDLDSEEQRVVARMALKRLMAAGYKPEERRQ